MHPDGDGSIAPGENETVGTEVITVETGGGNDKIDPGRHHLIGGGHNIAASLFFAAETTDKSCDPAAGGVLRSRAIRRPLIQFSNNNSWIEEDHINDDEA